MYSTLSTLNTTTEMPLSKAPNPQLLPGRRSINGCPLLRVCVHDVCVFTAVCVHFGWVKTQSTNSEYGSPYLVVCHFPSLHIYIYIYIYTVYKLLTNYIQIFCSFILPSFLSFESRMKYSSQHLKWIKIVSRQERILVLGDFWWKILIHFKCWLM